MRLHHYTYSVSSCWPKSFLQTLSFVVHGTYFWNENLFGCFGHFCMRPRRPHQNSFAMLLSLDLQSEAANRKMYSQIVRNIWYIPWSLQKYVEDFNFSCCFPSDASQKFGIFSRGNLIFRRKDAERPSEMKWISIHLNLNCEISVLKRTYFSAESISAMYVNHKKHQLPEDGKETKSIVEKWSL